ncbi:MAG: caspase family protein [Armatimonadetes bacterium]|nr:caspase family protein [Armatimonadota bacterium]
MKWRMRPAWPLFLAIAVLPWVGLRDGARAAGRLPADVPKDHWAAPAIAVLNSPETDLLEAIGDDTFQGTRPLVRYDLVKHLDNLVSYLARNGVRVGPRGSLPPLPYTDVPGTHYARDSIRRLLWMIPGDKTLFRGTQTMTRLDMAVWLHALLRATPQAASVAPAAAPSDVEGFFVPSVSWALGAGEDGLVSSYGDDHFRPDRDLTRYEMAYTLYQVLRWLTKSTPPPAVALQTGTSDAPPATDKADPEVYVFEPEVEGARDFVVVARKKQLGVAGVAADDTGIAKVTVNDGEAGLQAADDADLKKAGLKGPVAVWFRAQVPAPAEGALITIVVTDKAGKKLTRSFRIKGPQPNSDQLTHVVTQPPNAARVARKWALLVGVNQYDDAQNIPALRYSVHDVTAVYEVLVDPKRGGFDKDSVFLLTDETPDKPTNVNVIKYLNRIRGRAQPEDLVLVYFSGHGYEDEGRGYVLTRNTDVEALSASAIDNLQFIDTLDRIKAGRVVTIIDACHSGSIRRGGGAAPALSGQFYSSYSAGRGRVTLASASPNQKAWEDSRLGQGVFTEYVKQGLSGQADRNRDGAIVFMELAKFVSDRVSDWARQNGKEQDPMIQAENLSGKDLVLALNPAAIPSGPMAVKKRAVYAKLDPEDADFACSLLEKAAPTAEDRRLLKYLQDMIDNKITVDRYLEFVRLMRPNA